MEYSENRLRELAHRRNILEKKSELRKATLEEFAVVHEESLKRFHGKIQHQYELAQQRNENILKDLANATVSSYNQLRDYSETNSQNALLLEEEKKRYQQSLDKLQPLWKAQVYHNNELNLLKIRQEQDLITKRRLLWKEDEIKTESLLSKLELERRELMMQLALEQKDMIMADSRRKQIDLSKSLIDNMIVQELTDYNAKCQEITENEVSKADTIFRNQVAALSNSNPAGTLPSQHSFVPTTRTGASDPHGLESTLQMSEQFKTRFNQHTMQTPGLSVPASAAAAPVEHTVVLSSSALKPAPAPAPLAAPEFKPTPAPARKELPPAVSSNKSVEVPTHSTPVPALPPAKPVVVMATPSNATTSNSSSSNKAAAKQQPAPATQPSPATTTASKPVAPTNPSHATPQAAPTNPTFPTGPSLTKTNSSNSIVMNEAADALGSATKGNSEKAAEFMLSVPYKSPSGKNVSPTKKPGGLEDGSAGGFNLNDVYPVPPPPPSQTQTHAPPPTAMNIVSAPNNISSSTKTEMTEVEPELELEYEVIRHTDDWKLIQCAIVLKLLYSRLEDTYLNTQDPAMIRKVYGKAFHHIITKIDGNSSTFKDQIALYKSNKQTIGRLLQAAYNKREKELVIYSTEVSMMSVLEIVQERTYEIMPIDILNGIVSLDKLTKYYKRLGNGVEEIYNTMIQHLICLINKKIYPIDDIIMIYSEVMLSELSDIHPNLTATNDDKSRLQRKIKQLLKESVLMEMESMNKSVVALTNANTPPLAASSTTNTSAAPAVTNNSNKTNANPAVNTSVNSSLNSAKGKAFSQYTNKQNFVSLDDDEYIVEDEPLKKPPAMKDLSVYAEPPVNVSLNKSSIPNEDTEFDFL